MSRYLNGELIRVEAGREGSPVSHIVWDSYAQREVRIYPRPNEPDDYPPSYGDRDYLGPVGFRP